MINLARHIEHLLRDNDCVILPGFGGFISHIVPAYYVSHDNIYYPPSRSISFNASITMNDGLLAQSYMRSYNVDYAQATHLIDVDIEQLRDMLDENGSVTLPHIGTIKQDIHQVIQFTADPTGIASPSHFGLSTFTIRTIAQLKTHSDKEYREAASIITQTDKTIDVHIQKKTLHQVFTTAAIFILLLMIALPIGNHKATDIASLQLTDLLSEPQIETSIQSIDIIPIEEQAEAIITSDTRTPIVEITQEQSPIEQTNEPIISGETSTLTQTEDNTTSAASISSETIAVPVNTTANSAPSTEETTLVPTTTKTYHVIVESLPNNRGAEETLDKYINKGYTQASLVERDNRVRISLIHFTNKDEANNYLKSLRKEKEFQNAWLLPINR